jgi:hypothetical protein
LCEIAIQRKLRKSHHLKLRHASQRLHRTVAVIARDDPVECAPWQKIHELRERISSCRCSWSGPPLPDGRGARESRSNAPKQRSFENTFSINAAPESSSFASYPQSASKDQSGRLVLPRNGNGSSLRAQLHRHRNREAFVASISANTRNSSAGCGNSPLDVTGIRNISLVGHSFAALSHIDLLHPKELREERHAHE